jgi:manganese transport protein
MLIAAGAVFRTRSLTEVSDLASAYELLDRVLGSSVAATTFAVALLAVGQSSASTGPPANQLTIDGLLRIRLSPWSAACSRASPLWGPAFLSFSLAGEDNTSHLLVLTRVVLSVQLSFTILPLMRFVTSRQRMGEFALGRGTRICGWAMALMFLAINVILIWQMVF